MTDAMSKWTSVDDGLPAPEVDVLVWSSKKNRYDIAGLFPEGDNELVWKSQVTQGDCKFAVTHWMEIPK